MDLFFLSWTPSFKTTIFKTQACVAESLMQRHHIVPRSETGAQVTVLHELPQTACTNAHSGPFILDE